MPDPDYKRPFHAEDFRGYFKWTSSLCKALDQPLYHACHEDELRDFLEQSEIGLRSKWSLVHPEFKDLTCRGTWCGLNYFNAGNRYGPIVIEIPLAVLIGRTFMVFRRKADRVRYFFVQHEGDIPVFAYKGNARRRVRARSYFEEDVEDGSLFLKRGAIYDIVVTTPVSLECAVITAVSHPACIPRKCRGISRAKSLSLVRKIGQEQLFSMLKSDTSYVRLIRRFPTLGGIKVKLPSKYDCEEE